MRNLHDVMTLHWERVEVLYWADSITVEYPLTVALIVIVSETSGPFIQHVGISLAHSSSLVQLVITAGSVILIVVDSNL